LIAQLAQETYNTDLLYHLVVQIHRLEFESRKDVVQIFNNLLRRQIGSRSPTVEYLVAKPEILFATFAGYENEDVALNTGMILKEMLRYEPLCKILLHSEQYVSSVDILQGRRHLIPPHNRFYTFPHYIENTTFGVSCDAYTNLKETLTRHKPMVAEYLDKNYDRFFASFKTLISSSNYVTKRQSLKLLGEILLDRANFSVMTRYIADEGKSEGYDEHVAGQEQEHTVRGVPRIQGLCRKPEEAATNRDHPAEEQGQAAGVLEELPQRQRGYVGCG
jgi:calcium binding protein 39